MNDKTQSASGRRLLTGSNLVVLAVLFVAAVLLSGLLLRGARLDLTQNRLYTLSDGTKHIIDGIDEPIHLYFFYSQTTARAVPGLDTYATRVRELLEEIAARSHGKVILETIDPLPFSEAEDRAAGYGLTAVPVGAGGDSLYFGLAGTNATDGQVSIPIFQPDKETFLEYDVAKLMSSLATEKRPVVGILSSLDMGPGFDAQTRSVRNGWVIDDQLRQLFDVRKVDPGIGMIDDAIDLLVLVHPKNLSDDALYAVDQFVLRGGHVMVFVDPDAEAEAVAPDTDPSTAMMQSRASDLPRLFKAWGVHYDPSRVVLDANLALHTQSSADARPERHLAVLGLRQPNMNQDDVISAQLESVNLSTSGYFELAEGATTKMESLAQSSDNASTVASDRLRFLPDPSSLFNDFTPTGTRYVLAARLTGPVKSAFPEHKEDGHLAESKGDVNIVLFADTDMLNDRLWVQVQNFFGQRIYNAFANNGDFVINAVDNLIGSSDLIAVRTRATSARPFTTVETLKRQADDRFRSKEQELQAELTQTEQKLQELESSKGEGSEAILSDEQRAEIERFRSEKLRVRKELRQVRRQLDADIETLGAKLKFINIIGVPLLVTLVAIGFAWWRGRQRRQRREKRAA
ncbi:MAG: Gldg family protein [Rhodanobacteraceae bacterium]|nr:Gldg family protein [Xanthomonadales bacterium]MCP5478756.1 Gldg family protein [Rhodanobacteraceae bacterium]HPF74246.1 Gldg family protein [Xanthomonadaceae bacterium]